MKKITILLLTVFVFTGAISSVEALVHKKSLQDSRTINNSSGTTTAPTPDVKRDTPRKKVESTQVQKVPKKVRQNVLSTTTRQVKQLKNEDFKNFETKRVEFNRLRGEQRDAFKQNFRDRRSELKDKIEDQRVELKNRLKNIKDEKKKQIVERINDKINSLNERITDRFSEVLDKIDSVLSRVESRAAKAEANGKDVSEAKRLIGVAEGAISDAQTAVADQAGKVYDFEITIEENLRLDVGKARQKFGDDIKAVKETVKAAHKAVRDVAVALAKIPKVDELEVSNENESDSDDESDNTSN